MQSNVNAFFASLSSQPKAIAATDAGSLAAIAERRGFRVSAEEIRAAIGEDLEIETVGGRSAGWGVAFLSFRDD